MCSFGVLIQQVVRKVRMSSAEFGDGNNQTKSFMSCTDVRFLG